MQVSSLTMRSLVAPTLPGKEFTVRGHNTVVDADDDEIVFYNDVTKVQVLLNNEVDISSLAAGPNSDVLGSTSVGSLPVNLVLVATGGQANAEDLGLEPVRIKAPRFVDVHGGMQTSQHDVFAVGDINGISLLDSTAVWQACVALEAIEAGGPGFPRCLAVRTVHRRGGFNRRRFRANHGQAPGNTKRCLAGLG